MGGNPSSKIQKHYPDTGNFAAEEHGKAEVLSLWLGGWSLQFPISVGSQATSHYHRPSSGPFPAMVFLPKAPPGGSHGHGSFPGSLPGLPLPLGRTLTPQGAGHSGKARVNLEPCSKSTLSQSWGGKGWRTGEVGLPSTSSFSWGRASMGGSGEGQ